MTEPRRTLWWLLPTLLAASRLGCASVSSVPGPRRPNEIVGLVPPSPDPRAASPEPGSLTAPATPAVNESPAVASGAAPGGTACGARIGARTLRRSALSRTLDAGLGNWLRGVDVEPKIQHGHFQGWVVRGIYVGDPCWRDVDLQVGDVVNRINRRPVERPEQAQAVWTALRTSGEIVVEFLRGGQTRTLRFAVVDDGN